VLSRTKLQQFFIDTFGEYPQSKNEIGFYLKCFILTRDYIENNLEYFDTEIIEKYEFYLVTQFGEDFINQLKIK